MTVKSILASPYFLLPLISIVIRYFSFFPMVIDHDESTYLVIGRELLHGKLYLKDVIDTKPIGIFWIFAFLQTIAGNSIFWMRFLCALVASLTAISLYSFSFRWLNDKKAAWASGVIYLLSISIFIRWGLSPNTELFFGLFTILAFNILLFNPKPMYAILGGFLLGMSFMIKYVALADVAAIGIFILVTAFIHKSFIREGVVKSIMIFLGFIVPLLMVIYYYVIHDELEKWAYFSFTVTSRYPSTLNFQESVSFIGEYLLSFFPFVVLAYFSLRSTDSRVRKFTPLFILWILLDLIVIILPGKSFQHYFIQLMLPVSLLAGAFFSFGLGLKWSDVLFSKKSAYVGISLIAILCFFQKHYFEKKNSLIHEVESYLSNELKPDETIYTGNYHHILYFKFGLSSPTAYVHSSLLWDEKHRDALQIDLEKETHKIMESNPRFIILADPVPKNILSNTIHTEYQMLTHIQNKVRILEKKTNYLD